MVCLKKMFNGEIIFQFEKETGKIVLLQMKGLIQIIAKFRTEKISLHARFSSSTKHSFEGHEILCTMCSNTLKSNKLEIDGSLKENKLACFTNSKGSFQVLDLVRDFEKVLPTCTRNRFLHFGCACMYTKRPQQTRHTKKIVYHNFQFFQH